MQFGWTADRETAFAILDEARSLGCNFIDTADIYSSRTKDSQPGLSETIIGEWLAARQVPRHEWILATKVRGRTGSGPNDQGLSRHHLFEAVHASLARLGTGHIDLYQVHWPDDETPLEETLQALSDLVRAGLVRYIGCSNYPAWLLAKALWISDVRHLNRFETVQPHYNLAHRAEVERELQPLCQDQGVGILPYSPLAGGFLTGKYRQDAPRPTSARAERIVVRYGDERGYRLVEELANVAADCGATPGQIAVAWLLTRPAVCAVITGANSVAQLQETAAGHALTLADHHLVRLNAVSDWRV